MCCASDAARDSARYRYNFISIYNYVSGHRRQESRLQETAISCCVLRSRKFIRITYWILSWLPLESISKQDREKHQFPVGSVEKLEPGKQIAGKVLYKLLGARDICTRRAFKRGLVIRFVRKISNEAFCRTELTATGSWRTSGLKVTPGNDHT